MTTKYSQRSETISSHRKFPSESTSGLSPSEVQVKTSFVNRARKSWLAITISLIAIGGILGTVGATVVALIVLRQTTTTPTSQINQTSVTSELFFLFNRSIILLE
jgi:hypothetical protein